MLSLCDEPTRTYLDWWLGYVSITSFHYCGSIELGAWITNDNKLNALGYGAHFSVHFSTGLLEFDLWLAKALSKVGEKRESNTKIFQKVWHVSLSTPLMMWFDTFCNKNT